MAINNSQDQDLAVEAKDALEGIDNALARFMLYAEDKCRKMYADMQP